MINPLYIKIYNDYKTLIQSNQLSPGEEIPSEAFLRKKYACSRDTVRKATGLLEQKGYIKKSRGKASIVIENRQYLFPTSSIESFKEVSKKNKLDAKTICISLSYVDRDDFDFLNKFKSKKIIEIKRIRQISGEKIVFDIDYLDSFFVDGITKKIAEDSIYEYIEHNLGLKIGYAKKVVTVDYPRDEQIKYLDISQSDLLVCVDSDTYLKSGELFQHSISYHRYDKFIFTSYAAR